MVAMDFSYVRIFYYVMPLPRNRMARNNSWLSGTYDDSFFDGTIAVGRGLL